MHRGGWGAHRCTPPARPCAARARPGSCGSGAHRLAFQASAQSGCGFRRPAARGRAGLALHRHRRQRRQRRPPTADAQRPCGASRREHDRLPPDSEAGVREASAAVRGLRRRRVGGQPDARMRPSTCKVRLRRLERRWQLGKTRARQDTGSARCYAILPTLSSPPMRVAALCGRLGVSGPQTPCRPRRPEVADPGGRPLAAARGKDRQHGQVAGTSPPPLAALIGRRRRGQSPWAARQRLSPRAATPYAARAGESLGRGGRG